MPTEKVTPPHLKKFICTRCKRPYDTYSSKPDICDRHDCFQKGQEILNDIEEKLKAKTW